LNFKFKRLNNVPPHSEDWNLIKIYLDQKNKFLEIGVAEGRSVIKTAETLMVDGTEIVCVDPFLDKYDVPEEEFFDYNLNLLKDKYPTFTFTKIKNTSNLALAKLISDQEEFDFIYIDSRKFGASIIEDFAMSFMILKLGGVLMIDDYYYERENQDPLKDSKWAISMILYQYQYFIKVLHKGKRCIIKKTDSLPLYLN
jgi:predicted O-methyltransferase YrrM